MTLDLVGVAAIVGAIATPLVVIFAQYNTRRAIKDAAAKAAADIAAQNETLAAQNETLAAVSKNVDGNLSAVRKIADKFSEEVVRLNAGGAPTPYGEPSAEHPVTLSAGEPQVETTSREPTAPEDN